METTPNQPNQKDIAEAVGSKSPAKLLRNRLTFFIVLFALLVVIISGLTFFYRNYSENIPLLTKSQNNNKIDDQPTIKGIAGPTVIYKKYENDKIVIHAYSISKKQDDIVFSIKPVLDAQTSETVNSILSGENTSPGETQEQRRARAESLKQDALEQSAKIYFDQGKIFYTQSNSSFSKAELRSYDIKSGQEVILFQVNAEKGKTVDLEYTISSDNRAAVLVNSQNSDAEGIDEIYDQTYTQKIILINLETRQAKEIKQQISSVFEGFRPLALIGNFLYLSETHFESNEGLALLNLESGTIEDLSKKLNISLSVDNSRLSPNGQILATSTLSEEQGKIVNRISFFNLKNIELNHSKLISSCSGEFPGGLNCFGDLTWFPDSNSVYVTTKSVNEYGSEQGEEEKAYRVNVDGSFYDLPLHPNFDLLQILSENSALAVVTDPANETSSLAIISLNNGSVKEKLLENFDSDYNVSIGNSSSFLGIISP
jgi:hypothetical protein